MSLRERVDRLYAERGWLQGGRSEVEVTPGHGTMGVFVDDDAVVNGRHQMSSMICRPIAESRASFIPVLESSRSKLQ